VLAAAGGYVAWYGAWELRVLHGGAGVNPVVSAAGRVQEWLATRAEAVGLTGLALALAALITAALLVTRYDSRQAPPATEDRTTDHEKEKK